MAVWFGDGKEMIVLLSDGRGSRIRHRLACFGRKRHYRKDGTCKHVAALLGQMRPWHRARTVVDGWGSPSSKHGEMPEVRA